MKQKQKKTEQILIKIEPSLKEAVQEAAKNKGESLASLTREFFRKLIKQK